MLTDDCMAKLKIYVHSFKVSTDGFIDVEGALHECGATQAHANAFQGLAKNAGLFGNRYLPDKDNQFLMRIDSFCRKYNMEYDVVDTGNIGFFSRLKLRMKGIGAPAICTEEITLCGAPSDEDLKRLLKV